jgi:hypothetical protein
MTIEEAAGKYQYDVGIFAMVDKELTGGKLKWYWDINGGYCSVASHDYFDTPEEAHKSLLEFIKYFQPFDK